MRGFWKKWLFIALAIYLPGLLFTFLIPTAFEKEFIHTRNVLVLFVSTALFFVAVSSLFFFKFVKIKIKKKYFPRIFVQRAIFIIFILAIGLGISFFEKYSNSSFRHNHRFSEAGFSSMIVFLVRSFMEVFLLFLLCNLDHEKKILKLTKLLIFISFIFLGLTLNSSIQVIVLLIPLIILFKPSFLNVELNLWQFVKLSIPAFVIGLSVIIVGIGNKIGYDILFSQTDFLRNYSELIGTRVSTSLYSIPAVVNNDFIEQGISGLNSQLFTALNRINLLFGLEFNSEAIRTVDRTNYLNLFRAYNERAGATPYLLASMWYLPLGLGFFFIPIFFSFYARLIFQYVGKLSKITLIRLVLIFVCSLNLFEAPLNLFMLIDAVPFRMVIALIFFLFIKPEYFIKNKKLV